MATYDTNSLANAILSAMNTASAVKPDPNKTIAEVAVESRQNQANAIASAIETFVKKVIDTAVANVTVTAQPGTINVVGSPSAQSNVTPIPISGTGTIS